jgi:7-cyano-7-deazaguanine synthase
MELIKPREKVLLVFSGGQDSTTCLYWALREGYEPVALTINYGQRHSTEIYAASKIADLAHIDHFVLNVPNILLGTSPLVSDSKLEQYKDHASLPGGLEKTFVPMRNQLFLTLAANRAYCMGINKIITGVCEADFGGYPDCREVFIDAIEAACNEGTFCEGPQGALQILTPLMHLTKKQTVELAMQLGPECMEALSYSHTAYDGAYPPVGHDHATLLRAKGFEEAGIADPLVLRAVSEGLMPMPKSSNYDKVRTF